MNKEYLVSVISAFEPHREPALKLQTRIDELQALIETGDYSSSKVKEYLEEQRTLKRSLFNEIAKAEEEAMAVVSDLVDKRTKDNQLDPSRLTDDVKLLNCGVSLSDNDIQVIFDRNLDNPTMTQLIFRYAEEHGLERPRGIERTKFQENRAALSEAGGHEVTIKTIASWLNLPNYDELTSRLF